MKCVKYIGPVKEWSNKIVRLSDKGAKELVDNGMWQYCPKHEWKVQVRHASN